MRCACGCGRTFESLRRDYPYRARVRRENSYQLPPGRVLPFARRGPCGDVFVRSTWPNAFHGGEYHLTVAEVEVMMPETSIERWASAAAERRAAQSRSDRVYEDVVEDFTRAVRSNDVEGFLRRVAADRVRGTGS